MNIILLSGGSGKRLWPLSNDTQSKQFLRLLKNDDGEKESMVQRVMRQIKDAQPKAHVYVATNSSQKDSITRQLGNIEIISEPSRRDTFPAIALSAAYLKYVKMCDETDTMIILPIDVYADKGYFELLSNVETLISEQNIKIGLLGISPTYPSEKYGYIERTGNDVTGFTEKPTKQEAVLLIEKGALWNCGVFGVSIGYVLNIARQFAEFDSFEVMSQKYDMLPKISFDYAVVEKESSIGVTEYTGRWKDLGTWNTLSEEMEYTERNSNVIVSIDSINTHVLNMLDIPVIVEDIQNAIVVVSHDGILVSSKDGSSYIKPLAEQINQRPMYEQCKWGNYRVLEYRQDKASSLVKRLYIEAGKSLPYQCHENRKEYWIIINGKGILTIDGDDSVISTGQIVNIPCGVEHSLLAATEIEFIEVQLGYGSLEEDDADTDKLI